MTSTLKTQLVLFAAVLIGATAHASSPQFTNLTQDDVDKITKDLSSNTTLHSVLPPSGLGSIFGFELGVTGGLTKSPNIDEESKRVDANASVPVIPHAGLVGAVTTPIGITGEATFLPQIDTGDLKYNQLSLAAKWSLTDTILPIPAVNIALRGFYSKSSLSFKQTQTVLGTPATINVKSDNQVTGLQILASPKLIPLLEPYVGVGFLSAKGSISQDQGSVFANNSSSGDSSPTSTQLLVGLDVRLLLLGLGLEYSKEFGNDSLTAKLSLKF